MHHIDLLYDLLRGELAGTRAVDTATAVARFNRITGSRDFAAAVDLLAAQLRAEGADTVTVERFPIDGVRRYMGRVFAPAYEPHGARLRVVAPTPYTICDYAETPMCLPSNTPPTPPAGVTAEVVDVGRGDRPEHYAGVDVKGKAVMATGLTTEVYNLAVEEYGAVCVMTTWARRSFEIVVMGDCHELPLTYLNANERSLFIKATATFFGSVFWEIALFRLGFSRREKLRLSFTCRYSRIV